jgi:anthranilate synthase/indole-3-glycerol phosphate synthase/phosphoribosylanthranilate isomerase
LQAIEYLNLDIVQLHGSEPAEWTRLLAVPTFKAFHVDETYAAEEAAAGQSASASATRLSLAEATRPGYHSIPLLDTKIAGSAVSGGAGKSFDWSIASKLVHEKNQPLVLAGGLEVGNVGNAVSMVRPWAVDVCGGVETDGKKDLEKIKAFIRAAKGSSD